VLAFDWFITNTVMQKMHWGCVELFGLLVNKPCAERPTVDAKQALECCQQSVTEVQARREHKLPRCSNAGVLFESIGKQADALANEALTLFRSEGNVTGIVGVLIIQGNGSAATKIKYANASNIAMNVFRLLKGNSVYLAFRPKPT